MNINIKSHGENMKLIIENIQKDFGEKKVLKDCSYEFEQGVIYGLLGRNGSGKTTLFKTIYGDYPLEEGQMYLEKDGVRKKLEGKNLGMVFSQPIIPDFLTGYEFIKFYIDVHGSHGDLKVEDYFRMFKFEEEDIHRLIRGYSHGMKSKLNLITLFISKPEVMLLDEPLTSLDVVVANEIKKFLLELKGDHIIVFSTHILQLAKDMCDEIVLLKDGRLEGLKELDKNSDSYEEEIIEHLTRD